MFDGLRGLEWAKSWIESILKYLDMLRVLTEYRVEFAAYNLEGRAHQWWQQVKRLCAIQDNIVNIG
jgi:hypothetical protein